MSVTHRNITGEVKLPSGGRITYNKQDSNKIAMHSNDSVQVIIPLEQASFELVWATDTNETESKALLPGDICIIPPFLAHSTRWSRSHFVHIHLPTSFIHESVGLQYDHEEEIFEERIGINDSFIYQLGVSVGQNFLLFDEYNYKYFNAILVLISNHLVNNCVINQKEALRYNSLEQIPCEKIRDAMRYMSNHLHQALSVKQVADSIGMSQYHFMRVFKEMTGISPTKFHLRQRIHLAKELLSKNKKIIEVGHDLGFSSQSHFSNVFTKSVGTTPFKFQQQYSTRQ